MTTERSTMYESGQDRRPLRWSLLEMAVGLLLAWALVYFFGRPARAIDAPALVVALLAARYGYVHGVGAGLICTIVALVLDHVGAGALLGVFGARAVLAQALIYPFIGVFVGLVGDIPRQALRRSNEEVERLASNLEQVTARYDVILSAKEAVDRRVVGQVQTLASLYESARELETLDPKLIPPAINSLMSRFIEAEACAVYLADGPDAVLAATIGEHAGRAPRRELAPLIAADADGGLPDPGNAWLMLALLRSPDGTIRGAVLVERLPFHQHTAGTRQMVGLVAEWASRALANSEAYATARNAQRDHPLTGLRQGAYMEERLIAERSAARRYDLALSLIAVRAPALALAADEAAWEAIALPIAAELRRRVRTNDVAGHFRTNDLFLLILPCTPLEGARILASRIVEALPGTLVEATAFATPEQNADDLLKPLLQALHPPEAAHVG